MATFNFLVKLINTFVWLSRQFVSRPHWDSDP